LLVVVVVLILASVLTAGAGATGAGETATANRAFTVYSVATGVQYINTEDDRVRGRANNPLDDSAKKAVEAYNAIARDLRHRLHRAGARAGARLSARSRSTAPSARPPAISGRG